MNCYYCSSNHGWHGSPRRKKFSLYLRRTPAPSTHPVVFMGGQAMSVQIGTPVLVQELEMNKKCIFLIKNGFV